MASKNTIDKLFGSEVRGKILRFMFRNYPNNFSAQEISKKIQEPVRLIQKELTLLAELNLVSRKKK